MNIRCVGISLLAKLNVWINFKSEMSKGEHKVTKQNQNMVKRSKTSQRFWVAFSLEVYTKLISDGSPHSIGNLI
jgi:hypothetical protein